MVLSVILQQVALLFIYMLVGYILYRAKLVSDQGTKEFSALLVNILLPLAIIKPFLIEFDASKFKEFGIAFIMAAIAMAITIGLATLVFGVRNAIVNYSTLFCNAGFIGIPLVQMLLGDECVFFVTIYTALVVILQWTYGPWLVTRDRSYVSFAKIIKNPMIISPIIGIVLFVLPIQLPDICTSAIGTLGNMSGPVAMIITGMYLAQTKFRDIFNMKIAYVSTFLRIVAIPVVTLFVLSLFPDTYYNIKMAILIPTCTSTGANTPIFLRMLKKDYMTGVRVMCLSTIFSLITIPVIIMFADIMF